jgi:hypothetical protein
MYCIECYPNDTVSDVCSILRERYASDLAWQLDYTLDPANVPLCLINQKGNPFLGDHKAIDLPHGKRDIIRIGLVPAMLSNPAPEPQHGIGEIVLSKATLIGFGYSESIVTGKLFENQNNISEALRALLKDDPRKARDKLNRKEMKDLTDFETEVQKWVIPVSRIDVLHTFLIHEKNKRRALESLKEAVARQ